MKEKEKKEVAKVLHEIVVERMKEIFGGRTVSPDGYLVVIEEEMDNLATYINVPFEKLPKGLRDRDLRDSERITKVCFTI